MAKTMKIIKKKRRDPGHFKEGKRGRMHRNFLKHMGKKLKG